MSQESAPKSPKSKQSWLLSMAALLLLIFGDNIFGEEGLMNIVRICLPIVLAFAALYLAGKAMEENKKLKENQKQLHVKNENSET